MSGRLTDKTVRELPNPEEGNRLTFDAAVPGLAVRVTANGAKSWVLSYRVRSTGLQRRITLGDATNRDGRTALSVKDARDKAEELRQRVRDGEDPMGNLRDQRAAPTMADLATRYLMHAAKRNRERTVAENKGLLDRLILPALGTMKVSSVEPIHIVRLFERVSEHNGPVRANRVHSLLRLMFNLAERPDFAMREPRTNPAVNSVERNPEERRARYLETDELARLLTAIGAHRNQQSANIIRLALLTGARRGELLNAEWSQFNLAVGVWSKPSSATKQKRLHTIPLNAAAVQLLTEMRHDNPSGKYLFPGNGGAKAQTDLKRTWASLCKAAGLVDLRFHDLRHSFASFLASSGHNLPLIGQMLGHSSAQTTQRYSHLLLDPQREAAERVGAIIAGGTSGEVIPLPRRGAA